MNTDRVILGKNSIYSTDPVETGINNNIIVCGSSGCGKTMSITEPRLLEAYNSSLCVTVTKRRIVNKYKPLLAERGYQVWDLDFVHPENCTVGYDPLAYVHSTQDITFLAESIVKLDSSGKMNDTREPYWDNAAVTLLSAEIGYVLTEQDDATFADVLEMHDALRIGGTKEVIETNFDEGFARLERINPSSFAALCWKSFKNLPMITAGCVYGRLNTALSAIFSPELKNVMRRDRALDVSRLGSKKTVLFITTSPVNSAMQSFINIFYGNIFKQLFEYAEDCPDGRLPVPVHVLCDDFATGGKIINFAEHISIFREKGISVTLLLQSESQLESMYGTNCATTIINNCDTYIYMGGMDLKTAQHVNLRLNVPLEDVLYMPIGQEIIFRRGERPAVTSRYDILEDEAYQEITRRYEESVEAQFQGHSAGDRMIGYNVA